jgi:hypothetical protein
MVHAPGAQMKHVSSVTKGFNGWTCPDLCIQ